MRSHGESGLTLIEALIYLALFTIVIGGLVTSSYAFIESSDRNEAQAMLQMEQDFLVAQVNRIIHTAASISMPVTNTSATTLVVSEFDGTSRTLGVAAGNLLMNGKILNSSNIFISNFIV